MANLRDCRLDQDMMRVVPFWTKGSGWMAIVRTVGTRKAKEGFGPLDFLERPVSSSWFLVLFSRAKP